LNPKYVITIKQDINKLLVARFMEFVEETTWLSPIVIVRKKNGKLKIYVATTTKEDSYPLPFINDVLNTIVGYEV
jgi:hypothetical protein